MYVINTTPDIIMQLGNTGGINIGINTITNRHANIDVIGAGNIISTTASNTVGAFVYGNANTVANTSQYASVHGYNNNVGAAAGNVFGANNTIGGTGSDNTAIGSFNTVGTDTIGSGGAFGYQNTIEGLTYALGYQNSAFHGHSSAVAVGQNNTVYANTLGAAASSGGMALGWFNDIQSAAFTMGLITVIGSGITMASNANNSGTINFGFNIS